MTAYKTKDLLDRLYENPDAFYRDGSLDDLLKAIWRSNDVDTDVVPKLLKRNDISMLRVATWLASELAIESFDFVHELIPLLQSDDRPILYYTLECMTSCTPRKPGLSIHVVKALDHKDEIIRKLGMFLSSNIDAQHFQIALNNDDLDLSDDWLRGINLLINGFDSSDINVLLSSVETMPDLDVRFFCAALRKYRLPLPCSIYEKLLSHPDAAIRMFVEANTIKSDDEGERRRVNWA